MLVQWRPRASGRYYDIPPLIVVGALVLLGCSTDACRLSPRKVIHLAEMLPLTVPRVADDRLVPPPPSLRWRLHGLAGVQDASDQDGSRPLRLRNSGAEVDFVSVLEAGSDLWIELKPLLSGATATLTVTLNRTEIASRSLHRGWQRLRVPLPETSLHHGFNRLRLRVTGDLRVTGTATPARATARIRTLEIRSPLGRPARAGDVASVTALAATRGQATALDMPADSSVDFAVTVGTDAHLLAALRARPAPGAPAAWMTGTVVLIDERGQHVLASPTLRGTERAQLDVSLGPWQGRDVIVRLSSVADSNGSILWQDPRIESTAPSPAAPDGGRSARDLPGAAGNSGSGSALQAKALPAVASGHDVIIILLDACRADALSLYGSERSTPAIDALGHTGMVLTRAFAAAPWTAPSVMSLLTGLYPDAHGVESWHSSLPEHASTLAEAFARSGYRTVLWSQHPVWRNRSLRRGFEQLWLGDEHHRDRLPTAEELFEPDRPTFALLHLLLPHAPYEPPAPYRGRYADPQRRIDVSTDALLRVNAETLRQPPDPVLREYARDRYDETVAWTDERVGKLVDRLRQAGRLREALVVLTADHGEAFGEHGRFLHGGEPYDEVLRVPLIFRLPSSANARPRRIQAPASLIDVSPTLLDLAGLPRGPERIQGYSLAPELLGLARPVASDRELMARNTTRSGARGRSRADSVMIAGPYRLLYSEATGRYRLYDRSRDPEQLEPVPLPDVTGQRLLQALRSQHFADRALLRRLGGTSSFQLDEHTAQRLRALGYIQ